MRTRFRRRRTRSSRRTRRKYIWHGSFLHSAVNAGGAPPTAFQLLGDTFLSGESGGFDWSVNVHRLLLRYVAVAPGDGQYPMAFSMHLKAFETADDNTTPLTPYPDYLDSDWWAKSFWWMDMVQVPRFHQAGNLYPPYPLAPNSYYPSKFDLAGSTTEENRFIPLYGMNWLDIPLNRRVDHQRQVYLVVSGQTETETPPQGAFGVMYRILYSVGRK